MEIRQGLFSQQQNLRTLIKIACAISLLLLVMTSLATTQFMDVSVKTANAGTIPEYMGEMQRAKLFIMEQQNVYTLHEDYPRKIDLLALEMIAGREALVIDWNADLSSLRGGGYANEAEYEYIGFKSKSHFEQTRILPSADIEISFSCTQLKHRLIRSNLSSQLILINSILRLRYLNSSLYFKN